MGLIKAAVGAIGGTLGDQWKEYIYCDAIDKDILVVKGKKRVSDRSSNTHGEDNVISDGSALAVADGQCMIIVESGAVIDVCAEPGVYTYNSGTTPSVFSGDLKENLKGAALDAWERFKFGGGAGKDQRVYYFNTKEIIGNKYGTVSPIPFKVIIDKELGKSIAIDVKCNGEYSYRVINPMLFYQNVCGNMADTYPRSELDSQLRGEILKAMQVAFGRISAKGVDYSEIPLHTDELADALNDALTPEWSAGRGIEVVSFGVNAVTVSEEDKLKIQNLQQAYIMSDPMMAAGNLSQASADAMRAAAANEGGAGVGFMGMGFANMGGVAAGAASANMFAQAQQMQPQQPIQPQQQMQPQAAAPAAAGWKCQCGATATGKFCPECGSPKPVQSAGWTCQCGTVNQGKFCQECGAKKPEGAPLYRCDKCGWQPEDPHNPPKFCPECGDIFDENDMK